MVNKKRIKQAISQIEATTTGEIHVHLCSHSHEEDTLIEAQQIFEKYQLHKTADRNAILIFVALKSHRFALLGDIGIHEKAGDLFWQSVRDAMAEEFRKGDETQAVLTGVKRCGDYLTTHFPLNTATKTNQCVDDLTEEK